MWQNQTEPYKINLWKICAECGQNINEKVDSYLMECERCLSKKSE